MYLKVERFAQILRAEIQLGDLTVLVGPQASGKSLALQLLKLAVDKHAVSTRMWSAGLTWRNEEEFLDLYLGEGMRTAWTRSTLVETEQGPLSLTKLRKTGKGQEKVFFIPAHRALLLSEGWPQKFERFNPDTPVVARLFSDTLHGLLARTDPARRGLFPAQRLKQDFRKSIAESVFPGGGRVILEEHQRKRRLALYYGDERAGMPFMTWSVGQREFTPLMLGMYHVMPAGKVSRHDPIEMVIIEELEMGLHPKAIKTVMFTVLDLLGRGYRVVLSTHSAAVLDVVWAIQNLAKRSAEPKVLLNAFGASTRHDMVTLAQQALQKGYRVFAMQREGEYVESKDISHLDPGSRDEVIASWGGLTEFSSRMSEAVAGTAGTQDAA